MNIISRFFNIFRSNLPRITKAQSWQKFEEREKDQRFNAEDKNFHDKTRAQKDDTQNNYDPVLASYYANLELPYGAGLAEVGKAWKRLLRKYHPDLHSRDLEKRKIANELCQGLNRAYNELVSHLNNKNSKP